MRVNRMTSIDTASRVVGRSSPSLRQKLSSAPRQHPVLPVLVLAAQKPLFCSVARVGSCQSCALNACARAYARTRGVRIVGLPLSESGQPGRCRAQFARARMSANVRNDGGETQQTQRSYAYARAAAAERASISTGRLREDAIVPPGERRRLTYAKSGPVGQEFLEFLSEHGTVAPLGFGLCEARTRAWGDT
jgi:hypothetical protein